MLSQLLSGLQIHAGGQVGEAFAIFRGAVVWRLSPPLEGTLNP